METTVISIGILLILIDIVVTAWSRNEMVKLFEDVKANARLNHGDEMRSLGFVVEELAAMNKTAPIVPKISKESVFERDKIQPKESGRYVPIARRRAFAEQQSMGPASHLEDVRKNNAKAFGE